MIIVIKYFLIIYFIKTILLNNNKMELLETDYKYYKKYQKYKNKYLEIQQAGENKNVCVSKRNCERNKRINEECSNNKECITFCCKNSKCNSKKICHLNGLKKKLREPCKRHIDCNTNCCNITDLIKEKTKDKIEKTKDKIEKEKTEDKIEMTKDKTQSNAEKILKFLKNIKNAKIYREKLLKFYGFNKDEIKEELKKSNDNIIIALQNLLGVHRNKDFKNTLKKYYDFSENNPIASGAFGNVYLASETDQSNYKWVIKINKRKKLGVFNILQEMAYHYLFSKNGIGPKIHDKNAFFIKKVIVRVTRNDTSFINYYVTDFAIVLKKYDGSLYDLLKIISESFNEDKINKRIKDINNLIYDIVKKLLDLNIICTDIKPQNFLADWNSDMNNMNDYLKPKEIVMTDFGNDFCCNTNIPPYCDFIKDINTFYEKNNKKYIELLIYFAMSIFPLTWLKLHILRPKIIELNNIIINELFVNLNEKKETPFLDFIYEICYNTKGYECIKYLGFFHYLNNQLKDIFKNKFKNIYIFLDDVRNQELKYRNTYYSFINNSSTYLNTKMNKENFLFTIFSIKLYMGLYFNNTKNFTIDDSENYTYFNI